ncbi:uncharacterized protein PAC_06089 [Phialocephala subalpina]|uniref:Uncharacterized protein n=1 Tax=Phialocephala subalpina TaxID=576137 RepID=A0A1L7WTU9_9HELO|nr:uncharacterized protein PAC_06089 [Phialocephala subalpina]
MPAQMCQHIYHLGCTQDETLVNAAPESDDNGYCSSASCSCIPFNESLGAGFNVTVHPWSSTMTLQPSGTPTAEIDPTFSSIQSFVKSMSEIVATTSSLATETIGFSLIPTSMPRIETDNMTKRRETQPEPTVPPSEPAPSSPFLSGFVGISPFPSMTISTKSASSETFSPSLSGFVGISPFPSLTTSTESLEASSETLSPSLSGFVSISTFPAPTSRTKFSARSDLNVGMTRSTSVPSASQSESTYDY